MSEGTLSTLDDEFGSSSRRSFQSTRLKNYAFENDLDVDTTSTSRFSSRYKIGSLASNDDDLNIPSRKYSRYNRSETEDDADNFGTSFTSSSRVSRYSSLDGIADNEDFGQFKSTTRNRTKLSYLSEDLDDEGGISPTKYSPLSSRRYSSTMSYEVTSPLDDEIKSFSCAESSDMRKYKESYSIRSLSRTDSKDASVSVFNFLIHSQSILATKMNEQLDQ